MYIQLDSHQNTFIICRNKLKHEKTKTGEIAKLVLINYICF